MSFGSKFMAKQLILFADVTTRLPSQLILQRFTRLSQQCNPFKSKIVKSDVTLLTQ